MLFADSCISSDPSFSIELTVTFYLMQACIQYKYIKQIFYSVKTDESNLFFFKSVPCKEQTNMQNSPAI